MSLCMSPPFVGATLISVLSRLEGSLHWHVDVLCLVRPELGENSPQLPQMQHSHLLIQVLGQHIHLLLVLATLSLIPQLELGNHLRHQNKDV